MKKGILLLFVLMSFLVLSSCSSTSSVESSGDLIVNLPLYEFDVDNIPDYKQDISACESTIKKFDLLDEHDALKYGQNIFNELSSKLSMNSELEPIAILRDDSHNAWGVSFGSGGIGDGYSIAFFSNGDLIATWPEE